MLIVGSYAQRENQRFERLSQEAALFLMRMIYAAREEGVWLIPVSGYRSIRDQEALFTAQVKKLGSIAAAAKRTAPPGHSEHHTGYAVDLADGGYPNRDVTAEFVDTEAFEWLQKNAKTFGFELSFPENNPRGIAYEPWHWRYVGSPIAKGIFEAARRP
jgi:D-alanyl-D-alanine carboxypeptidase